MKKILLILLISVSILYAQSYNTNLILNGDAQAGFTNWNNTDSFGFEDAGFIGLPYSSNGGNIFFFYPGMPANAEMFQIIDISSFGARIAQGGVKMNFSAIVSRYRAVSTAAVRVQMLRADGVTVDDEVEVSCNALDEDTDWQTKSISGNILPVNTRKLKVVVVANIANSSSPEADYTAYDGLELSLLQVPFITFTDGSAFTQSLVSGNSNQVLGRFKLTGDAADAALTAASIKLNNVRTGLSNFKLWSSADASFGGDSQLGSTVAVDPGVGNSVTFNSFNSSISTSGTYYFLTADIAPAPTGTVQGVIVNNSSFTISGGTFTGTITNAVLSGDPEPLPVELTSFTASLSGNIINLAWQTSTEIDNYGFEIERRNLLNLRQEVWEWVKIGFVPGAGNSNSLKEYSYADVKPSAGKLQYRIKQINTDGSFVYYFALAELDFNLTDVKDNQQPEEFKLAQNHPNPFNPSTVINFQLPVSGFVSMRIYDITGREVATLVNEMKQPGSYNVKFNGEGLTSGMYTCRLTAVSENGEKFIQSVKMMLIK